MATIGNDRYVEIGQRLIIAVIILFFTFALPWYLFERFKPAPETPTAEELTNETATPTGTTLRFITDPLTNAMVGQEYRYRPQVTYSGDQELAYVVDQKPAWLTWDNDALMLIGTPPKGTNLGQAQLVHLKVTDQSLSDEQTFTIQLVATTPTPPAVGQASDPFAAKTITPKASVLGVATEDLPDTALPPWSWLLISVGVIALGTVIIRWQWHSQQTYRLSSGARLEVKHGRRL